MGTATIPLESIWQLIHSLSIDNRRWLNEKISESIAEEEELLRNRIRQSEISKAEGKVCSNDEAMKYIDTLVDSLMLSDLR